MKRTYAETPLVLRVAQGLRVGSFGVRVTLGHVKWPEREWEPLYDVTDIGMVLYFKMFGHGDLSRKAMSAAIRLAEGYPADQIWKVKRPYLVPTNLPLGSIPLPWES